MMIFETIGLTMAFGGLTAVDSLDLQVDEGEIRAVIGPNGSGKTTLLSCISGVYKPTSGVVKFKGEPVTGFAPHTLTRRGIGRTFQNIRLFDSLTVLQNVMVARHFRMKATLAEDVLSLPRSRREERQLREKSIEYLEFVGIANKRDSLASDLSFGQRRLVEIARALATEPRLLLLDEPAAGLSGTAIARLDDGMRRISDTGIAIIYVEHNMRFVMDISDRITVLDFGRKIAEGTPGECRNNPAIIECYLGGKIGSSAQA
jgi:branched-chain amino acid transport system ATP-binding protein